MSYESRSELILYLKKKRENSEIMIMSNQPISFLVVTDMCCQASPARPTALVSSPRGFIRVTTRRQFNFLNSSSYCTSTRDFPDHDGSEVSDGCRQSKDVSSNKLLENLRKYGISGILSYGLLNTVYYLATFFFVWFYVAPAPGGMGYAAAVERFLKVMAMVWVGSQVTKLVRAAGALALAPLVSRGLTWFTKKFNFKSEGKVFVAIVVVCLGIALLMFFMVTLLWA